MAGALEGGVGLVAGEVEEVDLAGAAHQVDGGEHRHERRARHDGEHVVAEVVAEELLHLLHLRHRQLGRRGQEERDGQEVHGVGDEVVVPQLHVLQPD